MREAQEGPLRTGYPPGQRRRWPLAPRQSARTQYALSKDGVLNLTESWLANPNLTVKYLADNIALLESHEPWLFLVTIDRPEAVIGTHPDVITHLIGNEQLSGSDVVVMHPVQDDNHALPGRDEPRNSENPADRGKCAIPAPKAGNCQDYDNRSTAHDEPHPKGSGEENSRGGFVAKRPVDEVGVRLSP